MGVSVQTLQNVRKIHLLLGLTVKILFYSTLCFRRTASSESSFESECPKPHLGNLAAHIHLKHSDDIASNKAVEAAKPPPPKGVTLASTKIMAEFLKEGQLHPAQDPTQKGFLQAFAAW